MYVSQETGEALTLRQVKVALPNVSFGPNADLTDLGFPTLELTTRPEVQATEVTVEGAPEEYEPGKWRQTWDIQPMPIPESVNSLQGMIAIKRAGLVSGFLAWKNSLDPVEDFEAIAYFDKAGTWLYDSPVIDAALDALGIPEQKDTLFRIAGSIEP